MRNAARWLHTHGFSFACEKLPTDEVYLIRPQVKAAEAALLPGVRQELSDARKHISNLQQERDNLQVIFL